MLLSFMSKKNVSKNSNVLPTSSIFFNKIVELKREIQKYIFFRFIYLLINNLTKYESVQ